MTNEEARKILDSSLVWPKMVDEECEALGMAIEALELMDMLTGRPCGVCKHHEHGLCSSWDCPFDKVVNEK